MLFLLACENQSGNIVDLVSLTLDWHSYAGQLVSGCTFGPGAPVELQWTTTYLRVHCTNSSPLSQQIFEFRSYTECKNALQCFDFMDNWMLSINRLDLLLLKPYFGLWPTKPSQNTTVQRCHSYICDSIQDLEYNLRWCICSELGKSDNWCMGCWWSMQQWLI